jgi:hypothetical protein
LREAVITPFWFELNVPVVAVNVALLRSGATMTVAGTLMLGVFDPRPTVTPPAPAAPLRPTAQILEAAWPSELGVHVSELTVNFPLPNGGPPVAVIGTVSP